jgi:hypothetical protein
MTKKKKNSKKTSKKGQLNNYILVGDIPLPDTAEPETNLIVKNQQLGYTDKAYQRYLKYEENIGSSNRNVTLSSGGSISTTINVFGVLGLIKLAIETTAGPILNCNLNLLQNDTGIWNKNYVLLDFSTLGYIDLELDFLKGIIAEGETLKFTLTKNTGGVHDILIVLEAEVAKK